MNIKHSNYSTLFQQTFHRISEHHVEYHVVVSKIMDVSPLLSDGNHDHPKVCTMNLSLIGHKRHNCSCSVNDTRQCTQKSWLSCIVRRIHKFNHQRSRNYPKTVDMSIKVQMTTKYNAIFFSVELTFALSLTELLSHLGLNICKTQDHSHSDTTSLYIYIYI